MNFRWQGQSCGSTSRVFVHRGIYQGFIGELARAMQSLSVGDPTDESTDVGPVVSLTQYSRIREFIVAGISDPALDLVTGGKD